MGRTDDIRAWVIMGALGAMGLAIVLIPLRTLVTASNLAFVFIAFTIVVAELGGRDPALIIALVSAMSLNFFLTAPYLSIGLLPHVLESLDQKTAALPPWDHQRIHCSGNDKWKPAPMRDFEAIGTKNHRVRIHEECDGQPSSELAPA